MMRIVLLLALLTVSECHISPVVGQTGENVTLSCKYDIHYYGPLTVCWGRGQIPGSGCSNQLISTDGVQVMEGVSSRYHLLGRLDEGDVSLTILNVTGSDTGLYGCRVAIPGLFNDDKYHFELIIKNAPPTTTSATLNREMSAENSTVYYNTTGQLICTETPQTSSFSSIKAKVNSSVTVVLWSVLFGVATLVIAGGLIIIIIMRRWKLSKSAQQHQVNSLVLFRSASSALQLHSRGSAVENIYQIDDDDGGGYEGSNGYHYGGDCPRAH